MLHPIKTLGVSALAITLLACSQAGVTETAKTETSATANATGMVSDVLDNAVSGTYRNDHTHSSLTWKVMHKGLAKYTARFVDFEAQLDFDAEDPTKSKLNVTIDPTTVRTDYPNGRDFKFAKDEDFDAALAGENWFNSGSFPAITFTSTGIDRLDGNTGHVTGDLTFLGVTQSVVLDVTLNGAKSNAAKHSGALGFSGHTVIKRSDYGLKRYLPVIADEVKISLEVEFYLTETE